MGLNLEFLPSESWDAGFWKANEFCLLVRRISHDDQMMSAGGRVDGEGQGDINGLRVRIAWLSWKRHSKSLPIIPKITPYWNLVNIY